MLDQQADFYPAFEADIAWQFIPGTSQEFALSIPCDEILYTGARGPGKTDVQLMRFRSRVGMGYGEFWKGVIFDREYKNLDDLVAKSKRWFRAFNDGAQFKESGKDYKWVWPTGEELLFRAADKPDDYWKFHGQEYPFIGWNELAKYPNSELYDMMQSCNRSSFTPEKNTPKHRIETASVMSADGTLIPGKIICDKANGILLPPIPLEIFSTTNPYGAGHNWVKKRFITSAPYGKVVKVTRNVFNPKTKERIDVVRTQVAIFGSYRENIYLDPKYVAALEGEKNPNRRKAWLQGDWDIDAGGIFDDLWRTDIHICPRFVIPANWHVDRAFDWGSSTPFSVIWFAEANGEEVTLQDGTRWAPEAGSLFQIFEWYGTTELGSNIGLKMTPQKIAQKIVEMEKALLDKGWLKVKPSPGPADNQIFANPRADVDTTAKVMERSGVTWEMSDKSSGSRVRGADLFRDRLCKAIEGEGAGAYIMQNNKATIELLPGLPRDPKNQDDVDTSVEDHVWDVWRYRVLKGNNRWASKVNVSIVS